MSHRRILGAAIGGLVAVAGLVALPPPASAAVPGRVTVSATSASTSADKGISVTCPAGKKVVGVGAELNGAGGQVIIDEVVPDATLTGATATAYEDASGFGSSWWIRVYATCATSPAGLVRVVTTSVSSSAAKSATVSCPRGTNVLGSGFQVTGGLGDVVTTSVNPNVGLTSTSVTAYEGASGAAASWSVAAIGICASPLPGLMRTEATSLSSSSLYKSVVAACPAGTVQTGGGFAVGGLGQVVPDDIRLSVPGTNQLFGAYEDDTGWTGSTVVTSRAVCATA